MAIVHGKHPLNFFLPTQKDLMDNFPPNSHKAKATEPREPIKPVTSAEAVRRKRGLGQQFKETFFQGTGREAIGFAIEDVVVPSIRETLRDFIHSGVDRLIFGESTRPPRGYGGPSWSNASAGRVDYSSISSPRPTAAQKQTVSRQSRARNEFSDLIIPSKQEANNVIDYMFEIFSRQGVVHVAELYELTGVEAAHTDWKWGWTTLRGAKAMPLKDGRYILDLPRPEQLA